MLERCKKQKEEGVYQIGEVAEITGLTHRTLRYYEEIGLLGERDHTPGKHRLYTDEDLERISRITRFKELMGHQLCEIKEIIDLDLERQSLREDMATTDSKAEKVRKLERIREIFDRELGLLKERQSMLGEVERLLIERIKGVDADIRKLK
ncbi:MAG: helix-turn-helix domain-containing protein [Candidatus Geothermincolia bacterium]